MVDYIEMHLGSQRPKHWPIFRHLDSKISYDSLPLQFADLINAAPDASSKESLAVVLVFHLSSSPYEPKFVTLHLSSDLRLHVFGVDVDAFRKADNEAFLRHFDGLHRLGVDETHSIAYLLRFPSGEKKSSPFVVDSLADVDVNNAVALQKRLKEFIPWTTVGLTFVPHLPSSSALKSSNGDSNQPPPPPKGVFMSDLLKGIRYALLGEIGLRNSIEPGVDLDAVNAFVGLLTKYFPGDDATTRFFRQINGWLQSRGNVTIGGREWRRRVSNADVAAFGKRGKAPASGAAGDVLTQIAASSAAEKAKEEPWIGCRGSRPTLRGYPCSLWTLFHVLSVAAADANEGLEEAEVNGREVVETMAKYVKSFFGCR